MSKFIWTDENTEPAEIGDDPALLRRQRQPKSASPPTPMGRKGALASAVARRVDGGEGTVPKLSRIGFETRRLKGEPESGVWR